MASPEQPADRPSDTSEELARHARLVRALAGEVARDAEEADELAAGAMAEAVARQPDAGPGLRVWFRRVVSRLAWRSRRRDDERRHREQSSDEAGRARRSEEATVDLVARLELSGHVAAAFAELDEPSRQVLFLRYFDDVPPRAIATQLGLPVETVKTRIKRGLVRLRERLDARYGGARSQWHAVALSLAAPGGSAFVATVKGKLAVAAALFLSASFALQLSVGSGGERDADGAAAAAASLHAPAVAATDEQPLHLGAIPAAERHRAGGLPFATGRVRDAGGAPLADVRVVAGFVDLEWIDKSPMRRELRVDFADAVALARTGEAGEFVVEEPTPGLVSLCFLRDGFAVVEERGLSSDRLANQSLEIVLPPGAAISGRVVDTDGEPVAGARVIVVAPRIASGLVEWRAEVLPGSPTVTRRGEWPNLQLESDAQGSLSIRSIPDDCSVVSIYADGYEERVVERHGLEEGEDVVLRRSSLFLDVVDARSGVPLADAVALMAGEAGTPVLREITRHEWSREPAGRLFIWPPSLPSAGPALHRGVLVVRADGHRAATIRVEHREGEEPAAITVALDPGDDAPSLTGRVVGSAEAIVEVRLPFRGQQSNAHSKPPIAAARAAPDGRFTIAWLPPARYRVDWRAPGCGNAWRWIDLPASDVELLLDREAELVVTARASDGRVVPDTTVLLQARDGEYAWAQPLDEEGRARFTGLPAGLLHAWLTLDRRATYREQSPAFQAELVEPFAVAVELAAGETRELTLAAPEERDVVVRVTDGDGLRPVAAGVRFQVRFASSPYDDAGVREALRELHPTDADGAIRLRLFHGRYFAEVHAGVLEKRVEFVVPPAGPADVTIRMPVGGGTATLRGRVTALEDGAALSGRRVVCFLVDDSRDDGTQLLALTDEEGRYEFAAAPACELVLVAYDHDAPSGPRERGPAWRRLVAGAGTTHELDFALARYDAGDDPARSIRLDVRVVDAETGEPIPQAYVGLDGRHDGAELSLLSRTSDAAGWVAARVARVDSYWITVDPPFAVAYKAAVPRDRVRLDVVPVEDAIEVTIRLPRRR